MTRRKTGEIGLYTGKTRSGKTYQLKKRIKGKRRVLVWSIKEDIDRYSDNWPGAIKIRDLHTLKAHIVSYRQKPDRIIYIPGSLSEFGNFCKLAFAWGIIAPCAVVAEELADVTSPGKAPEGWGNLLRQGAGWGMDIYGVTQRPSESDKTILGNLSYIHAHQIMRAGDREYIAREMDLPVAEINKLTGYQWIERWQTGQVKRGK